jgi:hypothetical protein
MLHRGLGERYSPMYFLSALGAGGLAVSFFMYLMFMVKHPDTPLPTFSHIMPLLQDGSLTAKVLVGAALLAIMFFAFMHVSLLVWNVREYRLFKQTEKFARLRSSNEEVALMAIPLTLAMTINVMFVLGAVFVPGLWAYAEYLFPMAILGFLAVGVYALRIFVAYMTRLITQGDFDFVENNNLSQMLAIFAFAMVSVGFAAPGAMSHHPEVNAVGIFFSLAFGAIAGVLAVPKFVLGLKSMFKHGISEAASPSLWITIPILTLLGIATIRISFGLHHGFHHPVSPAWLFVLTSVILSLELMAGLVGYAVMRRLGYFRDYLHGDKHHPTSYALICPGVAVFVFSMFFIHMGLVRVGVVAQFSVVYFALLVPLVYVQLKTVLTMLKLNRRLLVA